MTGVIFATWIQMPTKLGSYPLIETGRLDTIFFDD